MRREPGGIDLDHAFQILNRECVFIDRLVPLRQKEQQCSVGWRLFEGIFEGFASVIGFAQVIGDISAGARRVILFFGIAFLITAILVYAYSQSIRLTVVSLACSPLSAISVNSLPPLRSASSLSSVAHQTNS